MDYSLKIEQDFRLGFTKNPNLYFLEQALHFSRVDIDVDTAESRV